MSELIYNYTIKDLKNSYESCTNSKWSGAVNVLIVDSFIVLIKRSELMPSHKGQVGFIGGHKALSEKPEETALRELFEETKITASEVELLGVMDAVFTKGNSVIAPVVVRYLHSLEHLLKSVKSNGEWSELIVVKMSYFLDINRWTQAETDSGHKILFFPIESNSYESQNNKIKIDHILWGATGRMVFNFFKNHYRNGRNDTN